MDIKRFAAAALGAASVLLTAASPGGSASLEAEVLARINAARQHPRDYAEQLRDYRRHFEGRIVYLPGDRNGVITNEGIAAVDEAIDFLEHQAPLPPLDPGALLALAAQDHADAQGDLGATGHVSAAGASPGDRVRARGGDIYVGEGISYGFDDADAVVRQLIVDDGVRGRGHRTLVFDTAFRFAGVGCGGHRRFRHMCVIDFAGTVDGGPVLPEWARARGGRIVRKPTVVAGR